MQMALPGPDFLTADGGTLGDAINAEIITERRKIFNEINDRNVPLFLDEFVATDTDAGWGDGTSPLLSATAGAQIKDGAPLDVSRAERNLGPGVKVRVLLLERPYNHGSMLNDLGVRQEVLRAFNERRVAAGLAGAPRVDDVGIMTLELTTKAGSLGLGTLENVTAEIAGDTFATNNVFFQNGGFFTDRLTEGTTAHYYYHAPQLRDTASGTARPLRRSDLRGTTLRLTKAGILRWTCTGVRLLIDGQPVVSSKEEFTLSGWTPTKEIPIPVQ
jgi:hypothetical protein